MANIQNLSTGEISRPIVKKQPKTTKEDFAKELIRRRERDAELVAGVFKNLETPGGEHKFQYKAYKGDDYVTYALQDGERYKLPRGVARHLNNNCFYKEYRHLPQQYEGVAVQHAYNDGRLQTTNWQEARKIHRFAFHSLEFMDDDLDMYPSKLVEVTPSP